MISLEAFSQFIALEEQRNLCFVKIQELIAVFFPFYGTRPN